MQHFSPSHFQYKTIVLLHSVLSVQTFRQSSKHDEGFKRWWRLAKLLLIIIKARYKLCLPRSCHVTDAAHNRRLFWRLSRTHTNFAMPEPTYLAFAYRVECRWILSAPWKLMIDEGAQQYCQSLATDLRKYLEKYQVVCHGVGLKTWGLQKLTSFSCPRIYSRSVRNFEQSFLNLCFATKSSSFCPWLKFILATNSGRAAGIDRGTCLSKWECLFALGILILLDCRKTLESSNLMARCTMKVIWRDYASL